MDFKTIVITVVALAIVGSVYKAGKREGSRKEYGVGFSRGRRSAGGSGCMFILVLLGGMLAIASFAMAQLT